jgi:CubicO group peptidase (beta-lactamase class C family)
VLASLAGGTAFASRASEASDSHGRAVDALFAEFAHPGRPGLAVAIYQGGREVYAAGYGTANLEHAIPITPHTVFMAGSIGKQFTAYCVAVLAREKKIDLDADIRTYLPWMPDFGRRITVLDLIHHTSGLRDVFHLSGLGGHSLRGLVEQKVMLQLLKQQHDLNFPPGTEHLYSNSNYILLAEIVRVVSGRTLRELSDERIFKPLGMSRTLWYDDIDEVLPGRADSYEPGMGGTWRRSLFNRDTVGATSFYTTVEDLLKWGAKVLHPPTPEEAEVFRQMTTMGTLRNGTPINYGFGLARATFAGHEAWVHGGGGAAFVGTAAYFPQDDFAVAILANTSTSMSAKVAVLADLYLNAGRASGAPHVKPGAPDAKVLAALPGRYISDYSKLITISSAQEGLTASTVDGMRAIRFVDPDSFDLGPGSESRFHIAIDSTGRVSGFNERTDDGMQRAYERVAQATPDARALAELAGDYRSDELDVTYTLAVEEGRLTARTTWSPQVKVFTPSVADRFDARPPSLETILFVRDSRGRVTGFKAYSDRVRHVYFEKTPVRGKRSVR